jgi:hypothetical protein
MHKFTIAQNIGSEYTTVITRMQNFPQPALV